MAVDMTLCHKSLIFKHVLGIRGSGDIVTAAQYVPSGLNAVL